jgi:hypothetical protein
VFTLLANPPTPVETAAAMRNVRSWTNLTVLVGAALPARQLASHVSELSRDEMLFTLCRIAADLANADGGILGEEARAWTHELLKQRPDSDHPLERAISRAVARLSKETAIAHAHAIFALQVLAVVRGSSTAPAPSDGYLAFLMLAINDHIPEWPQQSEKPLTELEDTLGSMFLCSIFNRYDDPVRFLLRLTGIIGHAPAQLREGVSWRQVEEAAFGASFQEYADAFLLPLFFSSRIWSSRNPPLIVPREWVKLGPSQELQQRWLDEAAMPIDEAVAEYAERPLPSGLYGLPPAFFRKPLLAVGDKLLGLSPWHVRDHAILGTWSKLNEACKGLLGSGSNQVFSSAWGVMFEKWCAALAREASSSPHPSERLLLPAHPGAHDEIEDVIFLDGNTVALLSAKASLVPEASLKSAEAPDAALKWLKRFFFEEPRNATARGYRGGVVHLLAKKVAAIRSGQLEGRGISRKATILPCILSFDNVGEGGALYFWLEHEARAKGLLQGQGIRPITIITPEDYEALLALRVRGHGVCELLMEKTESRNKLGTLDHLLFAKVENPVDLRLPSMHANFESLVSKADELLKGWLERWKAAAESTP